MVTSGLAALTGWLVALSSGVGKREAAFALTLAWAVQGVAFVVLARWLAEGRDATRAWTGGIAARAAALLAAWPVTRLGLITREAAIVFGLGLAVLIILEAIWLATTPQDPGSNDK